MDFLLIGDKAMKDGYARKIILAGQDWYKIVSKAIVTDWELSQEDNLTFWKNTKKNVKIQWIYKGITDSFCLSGAVLPLSSDYDKNDYQSSYDMSDKQPSDIREDFIYSRWLSINKSIENASDIEECYCGLIPDRADYS